jgi:hypothetical protein
MAYLFKYGVKEGHPWIDYKEKEKTTPEIFFVFKIENYLSFILQELCVTYPCVAIVGESQLPLKVTAQLSSTQHQWTPRAIPAELFSSPSQNYRLGVLNEEAQGMRLIPVTFNYPCDEGDTITVTVAGIPLLLTVGCMIVGRKYGGEL